MTASDVFSQPFTQVTLPILTGFFIATVSQNRSMDDLKTDFTALRTSMETRFDMVMGKLADVDTRLSVLEDREKR